MRIIERLIDAARYVLQRRWEQRPYTLIFPANLGRGDTLLVGDRRYVVQRGFTVHSAAAFDATTDEARRRLAEARAADRGHAMSNRSLLEFNHDVGPRHGWSADRLAYYASEIATYLQSGDKECLPDGVTFIQMRHHSGPEPTGWVPPQDRKAGYRCLAFMGNDWRIASWNIDAYSKRPRPFWDADGLRTMASREAQPTHFAPLPDAPQTGEAGNG